MIGFNLNPALKLKQRKVFIGMSIPTTFGLQPCQLSGTKPITEADIKRLLELEDATLVAVAVNIKGNNHRAYASRSLHAFCGPQGQSDMERLKNLGFTVMTYSLASDDCRRLISRTYEEVRKLNRES